MRVEGLGVKIWGLGLNVWVRQVSAGIIWSDDRISRIVFVITLAAERRCIMLFFLSCSFQKRGGGDDARERRARASEGARQYRGRGGGEIERLVGGEGVAVVGLRVERGAGQSSSSSSSPALSPRPSAPHGCLPCSRALKTNVGDRLEHDERRQGNTVKDDISAAPSAPHTEDLDQSSLD